MAPIEAIGLGIETELALSNRVSLNRLVLFVSAGSVFFLEKEHSPSEREMFLLSSQKQQQQQQQNQHAQSINQSIFYLMSVHSEVILDKNI